MPTIGRVQEPGRRAAGLDEDVSRGVGSHYQVAAPSRQTGGGCGEWRQRLPGAPPVGGEGQGLTGQNRPPRVSKALGEAQNPFVGMHQLPAHMLAAPPKQLESTPTIVREQVLNITTREWRTGT